MAEAQKDNPVDNPKATAATKPQHKTEKKPEKSDYFWGVGRRKSSVARVRIRPGDGKLLINKRQLNSYFARTQDKEAVLAPLKAVECEKAFDIFVNVRGGGTTGQSGATRLGIARALKNYDENFLPQLREGGYLTRDSRMVERKKPGKSGARKRFQFSKR